MCAMFIKEMRHYFRSISLKINVVLVVSAWILVYCASRIQLPDSADSLKGDPTEIIYMLCYFFGIMAVAFAGSVLLLGSSCSRWRVELGDPAFSPGITTCIPPYQLALGKWSALMAQLCSFVLLAGILPILVFYNLDTVSVLAELAKDVEAGMRKVAVVSPDSVVNKELFTVFLRRMILVWICSVVSWGSATLAVCSLKPASRRKFDSGTVVAMLVIGPQLSGLIVGSNSENFEIYVVMRTIVLVVACLSLVCSGVSAPGANRLFFFKLWMFISALVLIPVFFRMPLEAGYLQVMAVVFLLCSLMERLIQSRRVLSRMSNPLVAAAAFPFTTGSLNSIALSILFVLCSLVVDKASTISFLVPFTVCTALVSGCNMAGFFCERRNWKFKRFIAFVLSGLAVMLLYVLLDVAGYWHFKPSTSNVFIAIFVGLAIVFNLPLIINYNYRKKRL